MNSQTKLYGLIGHPVKHSFSPEFQNELLRLHESNSVYLAFDVQNDDIKNLKLTMQTLNIEGLNITVPYKEKVISQLDGLDISAVRVKAVNTIKLINGKYIGYNTDVKGFERLLTNQKIPLDSLEIAVIGAGGAARAVMGALATLDAKDITIYNRTIENAQKMVDDLDLSSISIKKISDFILSENMLVINTTSVGLNSNESLLKIDRYYENAYFIDLIYNPFFTKMLKEAKSYGMPAINGLQMLIYQGIESFEIWHEMKVESQIVNQLILKISNEIGG